MLNKKQSNRQKNPSKLDLLIQMGKQQTECFELLKRAELSKNSGDLDSAKNWYEKLINISKKHLQNAILYNRIFENPFEIKPIVTPLLDALFILADILQAKGDIQSAEELRKKALLLSQKHLGLAENTELKRSQAGSLISQGRFIEALLELATCRDIFSRKNNPIQMARISIDIADLLNWLGDHERALSELKHAVNIIDKLEKNKMPGQQDILTSLGDTIKDIMSGKGDSRKAQDTMALYRISIELDYYQGLINKASGNLKEAETFFKKVLPEYQKMNVGPAIEYQLASILIEKNKYHEGLKYVDNLEPTFRSNNFFRPKLAALLQVQALALLKMGRAREALKKLNEGTQDLSFYYDPDLLWRLQWLKGCTLEAMNQIENALISYTQGAETVNNLRKAPLGHRLDSTYLQDKIQLFESAITIASEKGFAKECCNLIEMIKSRILATTLSVPFRKSNGLKSSELERKFENITQKLDAIEYMGYREGLTKENIRKEKELFLAERAALLERIQFSDPRWRTLTEPIPFDYGKISKILLNRGYAAFSVFYRSSKIITVLIYKENIKSSSVEIPPDIHSRMEKYSRNLQLMNPDPLLYDISAGLAIGCKHLIPHDLLVQALGAKGLVIIPHGLLHLVPWAGLIFNGRRLFEYCPIGILPNLSCIPKLKVDFSIKPNIALIGSPDYGKLKIGKLPFTEMEIKSIKKLYLDNETPIGPVLIGKDATESNFWELVGNKGKEGCILHIACHGTYEPDDPMNSGLLLSDSKVDAAEIARSALKYDEIILSSCSSGWRPLKVQGIELSGDDILGLPGAFIEAGASAVIVSIPKADDHAAYRFMNLYHQNRLQRKTPMQALQETQKSMLTDYEFDPTTWIGFTLYGCH